MAGSTPFFAGWFTEPTYVDGPDPESEQVRDNIIQLCLECAAWSVHKKTAVMRVTGGVVLADVIGDLVCFDCNLVSPRLNRLKFFFNKSSVSHLGDHLRSHPELRRSFDKIYTGT